MGTRADTKSGVCGFFDNFDVGEKAKERKEATERATKHERKRVKTDQQEETLVCQMLVKILLRGRKQAFGETIEESEMAHRILETALRGEYEMKVLHKETDFQIVRIYTKNERDKKWSLWVGPPIYPRQVLVTHGTRTGRVIRLKPPPYKFK